MIKRDIRQDKDFLPSEISGLRTLWTSFDHDFAAYLGFKLCTNLCTAQNITVSDSLIAYDRALSPMFSALSTTSRYWAAWIFVARRLHFYENFLDFWHSINFVLKRLILICTAYHISWLSKPLKKIQIRFRHKFKVLTFWSSKLSWWLQGLFRHFLTAYTVIIPHPIYLLLDLLKAEGQKF